MTTLSQGLAKAHIEVTTLEGVTYKIDLIDRDNLRLTGSIDVSREAIELTLEETDYSSYRQWRPSEDTIVTIHLTGLADGEVTREAATLDQPNG
jgi:hypothetical protein